MQAIFRLLRNALLLAAPLTAAALAALPAAAQPACTPRDPCEIRIGYIKRSFSPSEREGFRDTFTYLQKALPQYRITILDYYVKDLEHAIRNSEVEFFLGASGFYRRIYASGLRDLATMTQPRTPNPNVAVGTVFMVPKDSPYKTVKDLKGLRAAANWMQGWTGVYIPLKEIADQGYNPDRFFREIVPAGSPMRKLLEAVERGEADVAMSRACTLEELQETDPELVARFRPVGLKKDPPDFHCLHSTDLYPNWTFVSTKSAPWQASSAFSAALLSMPPTQNGTAWAVVSDFVKVDELYKTLKRGPYEYLRIRSVGDFFRRFKWLFIILALSVAGLGLHSWRTGHLVRLRTRELKDSMQKEQEARAQIESLERISTIGAMSSLITHELNGPLSAISNTCGALNRLFDREPPAPAVLRSLGLIERQCARASDIVNHVRNYVKHRENEMERIELAPVLEKIRSAQSVLRGMPIRLQVPAEPLAVFWNPLELELCVTNLVKNAAEACAGRPGSEISITLAREDSAMLAITVEDNAPTEEQALAHHSQPLSSGKANGLGLGLLIVRTLVEKAGGHFQIGRRGGLTAASITLPVHTKEG